MYDDETAALIRSTPELEGLDRDQLPEKLSSIFAKLVSYRLQVRSKSRDEEFEELLQEIKRLALTNEALVSTSPAREDRVSAAFVAATAHKLCINAEHKGSFKTHSSLGYNSISSDIAALILFLIAESPADSHEIASHLSVESNIEIIDSLILNIVRLGKGLLTEITQSKIPEYVEITDGDVANAAMLSLYLEISKGLKNIAKSVLENVEFDAVS